MATDETRAPGEHTGAEVRAEHIEAMGPELGAVFTMLHNELVWLHFDWRQYLKLFGAEDQSNGRLRVLNESAGAFFHVVQRTLADNTILTIARLTDHPKKNLSFLRLPHEIVKTAVTKPGIAKPALAKDVEKLIEDAEPSWGKVKTWRDKHLAHLDLATSLKEGATPVEPVTRTIVEDALRAMRGVLNAIQHAFMGSTTMYELRSPWDADALVATLRLGLKFDADRQRRLEKDQVLPDDWED